MYLLLQGLRPTNAEPSSPLELAVRHEPIKTNSYLSHSDRFSLLADITTAVSKREYGIRQLRTPCFSHNTCSCRRFATFTQALLMHSGMRNTAMIAGHMIAVIVIHKKLITPLPFAHCCCIPCLTCSRTVFRSNYAESMLVIHSSAGSIPRVSKVSYDRSVF